MAKKIKLLITGGAGFIGSEFIRQAACKRCALTVVDKLSYAGDAQRLAAVKKKIRFYKTDICDPKKIDSVFRQEKPEIVVHFAAESHVDRSILGSGIFIKTNVAGTQVMLDVSRKYGVNKFIHISTDEVYGDIKRGKFYERSPLNPSSPYSSSKAAADLLVKSYVRTFGFPAVILRPSNNFGPWQYPEKFIPVVIYKALKNEQVPLYGRGVNVREWLHVSDCAAAVFAAVLHARPGATYNVGSGNERKNIDVARKILDITGKPYTLIRFVEDRPGHDLRYSLDFSEIKQNLGWHPEISFEQGLVGTVRWFQAHMDWLERKAVYLREYWKRVYK